MLYNTNHGATNANNESNATTNPAPVWERPASGYAIGAPLQPVHIYRDKYKRIFAIYSDGHAKRLDNLEKMTAGEILEEIATHPTNQNETTRRQAREILEEIKREEKTEKTKEENFKHCFRIADELDEIARGRAYICPHCGEYHNPAEIETRENEDGETVYTCPACGEDIEEDEAEQASAWDYFRDCLDIEYITDSKKEYNSVRVCVAWGGPSIYIDTHRGEVRLNWWTETASARLSSSAVDMVDEFGREMFYSF